LSAINRRTALSSLGKEARAPQDGYVLGDCWLRDADLFRQAGDRRFAANEPLVQASSGWIGERAEQLFYRD
jgi:hypothetical protein